MYLNLEQQQPQQIALVDDAGRRLSYGDLVSFIDQTKFDLPERSLVFALASNQVGFVSHLLALIEAGHVPLLLSSQLADDLLTYLYDEYQPVALLVPDDQVEKFPGRRLLSDQGYHLIATGHPACPLHPDLELLLSTSGSTGSPKLVRFAKGNMANNAQNVADVFGWTAQEKTVASLPLNYVMGINVLMSHLIVGATALLSDANIMESDFWDFVRQEQGTNFTGVPISYEVLLRLRPERMNLASLRTFAQGGGKLSERTYRKMASLAQEQGWRFIPTYGTTETTARCAFLPPDKALDKVLSIGQAIPNVSLSLIDSDGQVIREPNTPGELVIEGNNVTMGYARKQADLTRGDDFLGCYATGDIATFDEDGYYYIKGRTHRFIKLLGNRIGLDEAEQILLRDCQTKVICIGQEDRLIILTDSADGHDQLKTSLATKLKLHPSLFRVIQDQDIPRTSSGKIRYHELEKRHLTE